jgi:hypothetical protein
MSYQVGSACYPDEYTALGAIAAAESGKVVPAGSVVYVVSAQPNLGGFINYVLDDMAGVQPSIVFDTHPSLSECGLLGTADALAMGWGVLAAWLGAYALLQIRKGL